MRMIIFHLTSLGKSFQTSYILTVNKTVKQQNPQFKNFPSTVETVVKKCDRRDGSSRRSVKTASAYGASQSVSVLQNVFKIKRLG